MRGVWGHKLRVAVPDVWGPQLWQIYQGTRPDAQGTVAVLYCTSVTTLSTCQTQIKKTSDRVCFYANYKYIYYHNVLFKVSLHQNIIHSLVMAGKE